MLVNVGASLAAFVASVSGWGLLLAGATSALERGRGARSVWVAWFVFVVIAVIAGAVAFQRSFPEEGSVGGSLYTLGAFVGIPSAAAAWAVIRAARGDTKRGWTRQVAFGFIAFVLALPVAVILAATPDIMRIFD